MTENDSIPYAVLENERPFQEDGKGGCYAEVGKRDDGTKLFMECDTTEEAAAVMRFIDDAIQYNGLCEHQDPQFPGIATTSGVSIASGKVIDTQRFVNSLRAAIDGDRFWDDSKAHVATIAVVIEAKPYGDPVWGSVRPSEHTILARCAMRLGTCVRMIGSIRRDHSDGDADALFDGLLEVIDWKTSDNIWDVVESMSVAVFRTDETGFISLR